MRHGQRVVAILPTLNEAESLGGVLGRMPAWVDGVVVADNGSTDDTAAIARAHGACVIREEVRGYGSACQAGIAVLQGRMRASDVVVFLDADGSDDPAEMARLADPVLSTAADLVVGRRMGLERMRSHQRLGTEFVTFLLRRGFGRRVTDLGPYRAIRWNTLMGLGMKDRAFGWTAEMQARALRFDRRVIEVPVSWRRGAGRSKISGTIRGTLRAGRDLTWRVVEQLLGQWADRMARRLRPAPPSAARRI